MVTELPPTKLPPTLIMPPINAPPPVLMTVRGAGFGACSVLQYSQVLDFVGAPQFGQFMIFSFGLYPIDAAKRLKLRKKLFVVLSASHDGGGAAGTYGYLSVNSSDNDLVVKLLSMALKTYPYDIERLAVIMVMGLHFDVSAEDAGLLVEPARLYSTVNTSIS